MFSIVRAFQQVISICLKIAVVLTNRIHSIFLRISVIFEEVISSRTTQSPTTESNDYILAPKACSSTQTENKLSRHVSSNGIDVHISNLSSSKKYTITQKNVTSKRKKTKRSLCENCKTMADTSFLNKDKASAKADKFEKFQLDVITDQYSRLSNSHMSIEKDIIDSRIIENCASNSSGSTSDVTKNGLSSIPEDFAELMYLKENQQKEAGNGDGFEMYTQKTSSFYEESPQKSLCTQISTPKENEPSSRLKIKDLTSDFDYLNNSGFSKNVKRRFSLPAKINKANYDALHFSQAHKKLVEDALKFNSRQKKSIKEIKYPFASQISLESKQSEVEDKEIFSCSSYESLPTSDHFRKTIEKTSFKLCDGTFNQNVDQNFSSLESLVETFEDTLINKSKNLPCFSENEEYKQDDTHDAFEANGKRLYDTQSLNENPLQEHQCRGMSLENEDSQQDVSVKPSVRLRGINEVLNIDRETGECVPFIPCDVSEREVHLEISNGDPLFSANDSWFHSNKKDKENYGIMHENEILVNYQHISGEPNESKQIDESASEIQSKAMSLDNTKRIAEKNLEDSPLTDNHTQDYDEQSRLSDSSFSSAKISIQERFTDTYRITFIEDSPTLNSSFNQNAPEAQNGSFLDPNKTLQ